MEFKFNEIQINMKEELLLGEDQMYREIKDKLARLKEATNEKITTLEKYHEE